MHPIAELFSQHKIQEIAIIDNYYDPPKVEDVDIDDLDNLWDAIEDNPAADTELKSFNVEINSRDDINNDVLKILWHRQQAITQLRDAFATFLKAAKKEESELDRFCAIIENDYGIKPEKYGTEDDITTSFKIIFIDYYMGSIETPELQAASVRKSISIAQRILHKYEGAPHKPVFILMSSKHVDDKMRDEFRDSSEIMGGMFYFISKNHISEKLRLSIELYPIAQALNSIYKIEGFIASLTNRVQNVSKTLVDSIKCLSISDYAYIQKLSLEDEAQPFGDYLLWLFGEHYMHLLSNKLQDYRNELNKVRIEELPPSQFVPSSKLSDIYHGALFEPITELEPLHLGDIFIKNTEVRIVLTPQCDLVRDVHEGMAVILLYGELIEHTKSDPKKTEKRIRTEIIQLKIEGIMKSFRIAWYLNRFDAIPFAEVNANIAAAGFKKVCRIKLPNALQIQNAFATNITRIGIPVAPPIYSPLKVEVLGEAANGKAVQLLSFRDDLAHLFYVKRQDRCVLKGDFVFTLIGVLDVAIKNLDEAIKQLEANPGGGADQASKLHELKEKKKKLQQLQTSDKEQLNLLMRPLPVPVVKGKADHSYFCITRGIRNAVGRSYESACPIWINVIDI